MRRMRDILSEARDLLHTWLVVGGEELEKYPPPKARKKAVPRVRVNWEWEYMTRPEGRRYWTTYNGGATR